MSDETPLIFGDAAAAEVERYPGRRWFRQKKKERPPLTHCENCGAPLTGRYCAQCGQPAIDYHRSFGSILADAADAFFNLDERFLKTFWLLLIKPWRLTNEFVEGKRVRYVHPLRVYLIASVLFFLVINFLSRGSHLQTGKTKEGETTINFAAPSPGQAGGAPDAVDKILDGVGANDNDDEASPSPTTSPVVSPSPQSGIVFDFSSSPPPGAKHPSSKLFDDLDQDKDSPAFARWIKRNAKEKMGPTGDRGDLFLKALIANLAPMVLCCIPLFSLVLKILYVFKKRFYIEHLVFALHTHAFVFLSALLIIGIGFLLHWEAPVPFTPIVCTFLGITVLIQLLVAIRKVYRQNWLATLFKFALGTVIYAVMLAIAFFITAFVTLALPG